MIQGLKGYKYYGILDDTYPIWKRNDIYLLYNLDNKVDWVIKKGNIYGFNPFEMWFYVRTPGIILIFIQYMGQMDFEKLS